MTKGAVTVVLVLVAFGLALVARGASGQDGTTADGTTADGTTADATTAAPSNDENVLRIGWAQDPDTLNPFVGQNEEDYTVWALNWDLPINFSPKTLGPAPGIAESWEVSDDRKTVTMKLAPDMKWSDGKPITSKDVKWSLDELIAPLGLPAIANVPFGHGKRLATMPLGARSRIDGAAKNLEIIEAAVEESK